MVKAYAGILACPVTAVQNSSFVEHRRPSSCKMVPVTKLKSVTNINKLLRPISLTSVISKLVQNFVVALHLGPVVLEVIDPNQYGCIPAASTLDALTSMLHTWLQATDGSGAAGRVVPFDHRKAFDISDHTLLFSVSCKDIVNFYSCTVTRPVLEYCSPIFHHSLPDHLSARVQKRALSIIASDKSYKHCSVSFGLSTLYDRRNNQCIKLFNSISSDQHKLACLCFLRTTKATTIPGMREFTTCPAFAQTASKSRSNQPCAVVQTCYYNVSLCVVTLFFFSFSLLHYH